MRQLTENRPVRTHRNLFFSPPFLILGTFLLLLPLVDCASVDYQSWPTSLELSAPEPASYWPSPSSISTLRSLSKNRVKWAAWGRCSSREASVLPPSLQLLLRSKENLAFVFNVCGAPAWSALQCQDVRGILRKGILEWYLVGPHNLLTTNLPTLTQTSEFYLITLCDFYFIIFSRGLSTSRSYRVCKALRMFAAFL